MTQYIGQITVILYATGETMAESRLRDIAKQIEQESDSIVFADHNGDVENYEELETEAQESLTRRPNLPARFDGYEIQPCRRYIDADEPDRSFVEPCEAFEADFWTVYGHIPGEGVQAIGDFRCRKHAEEVYARITGHPYQRVASDAKA